MHTPTGPFGGVASEAGEQCEGTGLPYRHIACLLDASEHSLAALLEARRLQTWCGSRLTVVYVDPGPLLPVVSFEGALWCPDRSEVLESARAWLAGLIEGFDARGLILEGHPAAAMCAWALRAKPDLIIAAESPSWIGRTFLGVSARHLNRHAPCPVLICGRNAALAPATAGARGRARRSPRAAVTTSLP